VLYQETENQAMGLKSKKNEIGGALWKPSLKWRTRWSSFGLKRILFYLTIIFAANMGVQIYWFATEYQEAQVLQNMVVLYNNIIDYWNVHSMILMLINEISLRGTDFTVKGKPVLDVFDQYNDYFKNVIIDKVMHLREKNLGNFTEAYRNLTSSDNLCKNLSRVHEKRYRTCGEGAGGYLKNNLAIVLKGLQISAENFARTVRRGGHGRMVAFYDEDFKTFLNYGLQNGLHSEIYYMVLIPLSKHIEGYIYRNVVKEKGATVEINLDIPFYLKLSIPIYLILIIASYSCFLKTVSHRNEEFKNILYVAPFDKLLKNRPVTEFIKSA
jgi:hypothetical protein